MSIPTRAVSLALALLAACSDDSDDVVQTENVQVGPQICDTLDYAQDRPASDFYRFFPSDQAAADFMQTLSDTGQLASVAGPDATFKEIASDPRTLRLIDQVIDGFRVAFPKAMDGLTEAPKVAIVDSEIPNAYALGTGFDDGTNARTDQQPWLFVVQTGLLDHPATDSEIRGLFAHELGHLILRNGLSKTRQAIDRSYRLNGSEDGVLGEIEPNNPQIADHIARIEQIQRRIGGLPELGHGTLTSGTYNDILAQFIASVPACSGVTQRIEDLARAQAHVIPAGAEQNFVPRKLSAAERQNFEHMTTAIREALQGCGSEDHTSIAALYAALNGLPPSSVNKGDSHYDALQSLLLDAEKRADKELPDANLAVRLMRAEELMRPDLIMLRADPNFPIDELRLYDIEEDADDAAVRVLRAIGDDPTAIGMFLLTIVPSEARDRCLADVEAGKPIPYGDLIDVHPATCWRYYHAVQLSKALEMCAPPSGTPLARR